MSLFQFYSYIDESLHVSGLQARPQENSHSCSHKSWFSGCTVQAACSIRFFFVLFRSYSWKFLVVYYKYTHICLCSFCVVRHPVETLYVYYRNFKVVSISRHISFTSRKLTLSLHVFTLVRTLICAFFPHFRLLSYFYSKK
jgi:hypothetical protein